MNWVDATTRLPEPGVAVAVTAIGSYGSKYWARAQWIPEFFMSTDDNDFDGPTDYNEEEDVFYWPPGWYEWNQYEEMHWKLDGQVTHWAVVRLAQEEECKLLS